MTRCCTQNSETFCGLSEIDLFVMMQILCLSLIDKIFNDLIREVYGGIG